MNLSVDSKAHARSQMKSFKEKKELIKLIDTNKGVVSNIIISKIDY